ncbi:right-handed parallel beta-helix repeat-containing protein [Sphingomonas prati]|uniref:Right handed beta helix domain-containing protein n=1 Tax=Sphingomonas prati TaxID=1843237 RepID=A0A7W9BQT2_9SPHN|nr:right-handed parallel beta-helix repeat-containing protein [Sphingomonas prati]MBB5728259.1 hypothetical protein [Sphingomonas prati]GGE75191.1 hypothetical protein GCM10011404_04710 [Sphingomonas prati]
MFQAGFFPTIVAIAPSRVPPVQARYIAPSGTGDGSSWANAAPITALNDLIGQLTVTGGEVRVRADAGSYTLPGSQIVLNKGGTLGKPVIIRGSDVLGQAIAAEMLGNRQSPRWQPGGATGAEQIWFNAGASNLIFRDFRFRNAGTCFRLREANTNLLFEDIRGDNIRRLIQGSGTNATIVGLTIRRCSGYGFSKQFIHVRYDSSNVLIEDCYADAEMQDGDLWSAGFVLDDTAHDVTMRRCVGRNCVYNAGTLYWNADAFAGEGGNYRIKLYDCEAHDCTDGGYDFKSEVELFNCIGDGNKRNFRMWGPATLYDCIGRNPKDRGGTGSAGQVYSYNKIGCVRVKGGSFTQQADNMLIPFHVFDYGFLTIDAAAQAGTVKPASVPLWTDEGRPDALFTIWDVNDTTLPQITTDLNFTVDENLPRTFDIAMTEAASIEISGPDRAKFEPQGRSLIMKPQDFEAPGGPSVLGGNVLRITLTAVDANKNRSVAKAMNVIINDVADDPIAPAEAFGYSGSDGAWFDIGDMSTLWADVAMTQPAQVGGLVAAVTDQSGRGHHLRQDDPDRQARLRQVNFTTYLEFDGYQTFYRLGSPGDMRFPAFTMVLSMMRDVDSSTGLTIALFFGRRGTTTSLDTNGTFWFGPRGGTSASFRTTGTNGTSNGIGTVSNKAVALSYRTSDGIVRSSNNTLGVGMATIIDAQDVAANPYPLTTEQPLVGARWTPETGYIDLLNGRLYGLAVLNAAVSDDTRFRIERQLGRTGGVSI